MLTYLDTSAAMKLLVREAGTAALLDLLRSASTSTVVASWLLHTELHCAAGRRPEVVDPDVVAQVLDRVTLVDLSRGDLISAGTHAPLRSQDAIHLAVALRLGVDRILTYDAELAEAATRAGVVAIGPL